MKTTKRHHGFNGRYPTKPPPWKYKNIHIWTSITKGSSSTCRTINLSTTYNDEIDISYPNTTTSKSTSPPNRLPSRQPTRTPTGDAPLTPIHPNAMIPPAYPIFTIRVSPSPGPYRHPPYGRRHDKRRHEHQPAHHTPARHPSDSKQHPTTHPSDYHVIKTHTPETNTHYDRHPSDIHLSDSPTPIRSDTFEDTHHAHHYRLSYKINPISLSTTTPPSYGTPPERGTPVTFAHIPLSYIIK